MKLAPLLLVLVALGFVEVINGWGPMSHYDMGCHGLFGQGDIISCSEIPDGNQSIQGMALPDAFFFGGAFTTGGACSPELAYLHDATFAGYMVLLANNTNPSQLNFSLGFGSHVISDVAGFSNGYLSGPLVHWLSVWQNMLAQDAYIGSYWEENYGLPEDQLLAEIELVSEPITEEQAAWVSTATSYYNTFNPDFKPVSETDIMACAQVWSTALESVSTEAVEKKSDCFQQEMVHYDTRANDWDSAQRRYTKFNSCGRNTISYWRDSLLQGQAPEAAYSSSVLYVEKHCPF